MMYESTILKHLSQTRRSVREDNRGSEKPIVIDFKIGSLFVLSNFEKRFLSQIIYLSKKNGVCFAKDSYFENLFLVSKGAVRRKIKFFKDCGFISVFKEFGCRLIKVNNKEIDEAVKELSKSLLTLGKEINTLEDDFIESEYNEATDPESASSSSEFKAPEENAETIVDDGEELISQEDVEVVEKCLEELVSYFTMGGEYGKLKGSS